MKSLNPIVASKRDTGIYVVLYVERDNHINFGISFQHGFYEQNVRPASRRAIADISIQFIENNVDLFFDVRFKVGRKSWDLSGMMVDHMACEHNDRRWLKEFKQTSWNLTTIVSQ